jgi:hypothetical protein
MSVKIQYSQEDTQAWRTTSAGEGSSSSVEMFNSFVADLIRLKDSITDPAKFIATQNTADGIYGTTNPYDTFSYLGDFDLKYSTPAMSERVLRRNVAMAIEAILVTLKSSKTVDLSSARPPPSGFRISTSCHSLRLEPAGFQYPSAWLRR